MYVFCHWLRTFLSTITFRIKQIRNNMVHLDLSELVVMKNGRGEKNRLYGKSDMWRLIGYVDITDVVARKVWDGVWGRMWRREIATSWLVFRPDNVENVESSFSSRLKLWLRSYQRGEIRHTIIWLPEVLSSISEENILFCLRTTYTIYHIYPLLSANMKLLYINRRWNIIRSEKKQFWLK